mmetsp:Transcript_23138/g.54708  ORF Transcript_23138/g.54708 Transcript_23138/m.54708 type:complete len:200 (+) Transcript_23138:355-954(+)
MLTEEAASLKATLWWNFWNETRRRTQSMHYTGNLCSAKRSGSIGHFANPTELDRNMMQNRNHEQIELLNQFPLISGSCSYTLKNLMLCFGYVYESNVSNDHFLLDLDHRSLGHRHGHRSHQIGLRNVHHRDSYYHHLPDHQTDYRHLHHVVMEVHTFHHLRLRTVDLCFLVDDPCGLFHQPFDRIRPFVQQLPRHPSFA